MSFSHPADLIRKYYQTSPAAHRLLLEHSRLVTRKALHIARSLSGVSQPDLQFIAEAAMLHDIGMIYTHAPELQCFGQLPYLAHGIKGAEILRTEGMPRHARVCERHTGIGLTAEEILQQKLPLPPRDYLPETLEEKIICYADLFFSKNQRDHGRQKSLAEVRKTLVSFGEEKGEVLDDWAKQFEPASGQRSD
ncbi:HD domain-containing protein [Geopsychrobacter electrodiphilus]|uniref:HD domain-containing protein n=1 Tax=Geopsychrobacter electrodiphilus TaxID=225196 RepID=UPI00035DF3F9|nr:HD domain-containing protein [Geopsychrobacter electrodiphilus]